MKSLVPPEIEEYAQRFSSPVPPLLEEVERETYRQTAAPQMLTGRVEGKFLQLLVRIIGARKVVELGTFTGYSALMMAEALPEDGELVTCENVKAYARIAQSFFDRSPHGHKIRIAFGHAIETLRRLLDESADFIFIDADKASYPLYYEESVRLVRKGGLIVADNVLWSGRVLLPDDNESRAIVEFNKRVAEDGRVEKVMLTVRDGISLIRKV